MTEEILPIDREVLEEQTKEIELEEKQKNTAPPIEEPEEEIDNDPEGADPVVDETDVFQKPKQKKKGKYDQDLDSDLTARGTKRKRVMTEKQKENLRKAQVKSVLRRKEMKAAKELALKEKQAAKEIELEAKMEKEMGQNLKLKIAEKYKNEAQKNATWDEDRLTALMEKTLDSYMKKRKDSKPKPKEFIPHPQPQPQYQYVPPGYVPQAQPMRHQGYTHAYRQPTGQSLDDPYKTLFGDYN